MSTVRTVCQVLTLTFLRLIGMVGTMSKPLRKPVRVTMLYPDDLLERVKTFQHAHKLNDRSDAIRRLIEVGLKAEAAPRRK